MKIFMMKDSSDEDGHIKEAVACIRKLKGNNKIYLMGRDRHDWELVIENKLDGYVDKPYDMHDIMSKLNRG